MNINEHNFFQEIRSLGYLYNKCISLKKTRNIIRVIYFEEIYPPIVVT